jgi:nitrogen fixation protein FixH
MRHVAFAAAAALVAALALSPLHAQSAVGIRIRATIERVDGATLTLRTRAGDEVELRVMTPSTLTAVVPATLADIKPNTFVGVAAEPGDDDTLKAVEVHIFPESQRGSGEGSRPFDLSPTSSMTNGSVNVKVDGRDGPVLTVVFNGGERKILVAPGTPIVTFAAGAADDLKPGAGIIAFNASKAADGVYEAQRVIVGRGIAPPM